MFAASGGRGSVTLRALVLGLNEIASAVAVELFKAGYGVIMSHDPNPPVIRRGMAFYDALFLDPISVGGVSSVCVENTLAARNCMTEREFIAVTRLGPHELLTIDRFDVLVDARMQKKAPRPDLRAVANVTVGLWPGFAVGENCDVAIETQPAKQGTLVKTGATLPADGVSRQLGGVGAERFVYSPAAGAWRTSLDVGMRVFKGLPLGLIDDIEVHAPIDGILRGIARDGSKIPNGVKLIEIDPRGRDARWTGTDDRGLTIAQATVLAVFQARAGMQQRRSKANQRSPGSA